MQDTDNFEFTLSGYWPLALIVVLIFMFFCFECIIFSRLESGKYLQKGVDYLENARSKPKDMLVERSVLYQGALKSLDLSIKANAFDSRPYSEYGQALLDIASDAELRGSLDEKKFGFLKNGGIEFLNLAKSYFTQAIINEPTNSIYYQRLGSVYSSLSEEGKAETEFSKALMLDPQNLTIYLYLCQYFQSRGDHDKFDYYLQKTVDLFRKSQVQGGVIYDMTTAFFKSIGKEDLLNKTY